MQLKLAEIVYQVLPTYFSVASSGPWFWMPEPSDIYFHGTMTGPHPTYLISFKNEKTGYIRLLRFSDDLLFDCIDTAFFLVSGVWQTWSADDIYSRAFRSTTRISLLLFNAKLENK